MVRFSTFVTAVLFLGCSLPSGGSSDSEDVGPDTVTAPMSVRLTPEAGGRLETVSGHRLIVPPGAVSEAVEVTLTPVTEFDRSVLLSAVELEPHGLEFEVPARLELPLNWSYQPGTTFPGAGFSSAGATDFVTSYESFRVDGTGRIAGGPLYSFSGHAVAKNCHAGTRDHLMQAWQGDEERDLNARAEELGLDIETVQGACLRVEPLQDLISPYLEKCYEAATEEPFSQSARAEIEQRVSKGQEVVFLFGSQLETEENGFWEGVVHSGVAVLSSDGSVAVKNQLNVSEAVARMLPAGATSIEQPLADIDRPGVGLRDLRAGEPGALWVRGETLSDSQRGGSERRIWSHVVVLCERASETGINVLSANLTIDGVPLVLKPDLILAMPDGSFEGSVVVSNVPTIHAIEGTPASIDTSLAVMLDPRQLSEGISLHAVGPVSAVFEEQVAEAAVLYTSNDYLHADDSMNVVFESTEGSIKLWAFGTVPGERIEGELTASLSGEQVVSVDENGSPVTRELRGEVSMEFSVWLSAEP